MPILQREPDTYPEDLLERPELGCEQAVRWWALYTLSRHEKDLMRRLRGLQIPFYNPLVPKRTCSPRGRVRNSHVPLFTSYVFIYGDVPQRSRALTTNCVSRWLSVPDGLELTEDLRQISRLIAAGVPLTPEAKLESGMAVRIRSGPLAGLEGTVIKRFNHQRLLIAVRFLKQGASVLIEDFRLERID